MHVFVSYKNKLLSFNFSHPEGSLSYFNIQLKKMHREQHKTMDIFCYTIFLLILTARICSADEGNRKGCAKKVFNEKICAFALKLLFGSNRYILTYHFKDLNEWLLN